MISGDYGWYTIDPFVSMDNQTITFNSRLWMTLYSPDGSSDVMTVRGSQSGYYVQIFLPSMTGVEALLVEEGGMLKKNQDPESVQAFLLDQGYALMPDWYEMDRWNNEISAGFKTSKGTFFGEPGTYDDIVNLHRVDVNIGSEGLRDYDLYHNYYGTLSIHINAASLEEFISIFTNYMDEVGLAINMVIHQNSLKNSYTFIKIIK